MRSLLCNTRIRRVSVAGSFFALVPAIMKDTWTPKYAAKAYSVMSSVGTSIPGVERKGYCPLCDYWYERLGAHYRSCLSKADLQERERLMAIEQAKLFEKKDVDD